MAKKIFILLTVHVDSGGVISYDMEKFDTKDDAHSAGEQHLKDWMAENDMTEECDADEYSDNTCKITRYDNLVEACDTMSIAEFDYNIKEFEI